MKLEHRQRLVMQIRLMESSGSTRSRLTFGDMYFEFTGVREAGEDVQLARSMNRELEGSENEYQMIDWEHCMQAQQAIRLMRCSLVFITQLIVRFRTFSMRWLLSWMILQ